MKGFTECNLQPKRLEEFELKFLEELSSAIRKEGWERKRLRCIGVEDYPSFSKEDGYVEVEGDLASKEEGSGPKKHGFARCMAIANENNLNYKFISAYSYPKRLALKSFSSEPHSH